MFAEFTMVVSVTEPKLLMKILHVTLTGGPERQTRLTFLVRDGDVHLKKKINIKLTINIISLGVDIHGSPTLFKML